MGPEGQTRRATAKGPSKGRLPKKIVALGTELLVKEHDAILEVLRSNADVFAWSPENILGVARETIEHRLAI